jgi:hypothetical protein
MKLSASQVETFRLCKRKWAYKALDKIYEPSGPGAEKGDRVHKAIEAYLLTGVLPDATTEEGAIALSGVHLQPTPRPKNVSLRVEEKREFATQAAQWMGRVDAAYKDPDGIEVIHDHKTTKSKKWAKTPEDLCTDVQANLYAHSSMRFNTQVRARWVYHLTGEKRDAWAVEQMLHRDQVAEQIEQIDETAKEMVQLYQVRPKTLELPPSPNACNAFGGCPHRNRCNLSLTQTLFPEEKMSEKKIENFLAQAVAWKPGDPLNEAQRLLQQQGKPLSVLAFAADNPPDFEVALDYDRPLVNKTINPPEAPDYAPASPEEMPPVEPVAVAPRTKSSAPPAGDREALKAECVRRGLVPANTRLRAEALRALLGQSAPQSRPDIMPIAGDEGSDILIQEAQFAPLDWTAKPLTFDRLADAVDKVVSSPQREYDSVIEAAKESPKERIQKLQDLVPEEVRESVQIEVLYVDCAPLNTNNVYFFHEIYADIRRGIQEKESLADYRLAEYGRGPGLLQAYLATYLDNYSISQLVVDSRVPEGRDCLTLLMSRALTVVRAL